jgi:hypothetical protein
MAEESFPPILSFKDILGTDDLNYGFIKCRLVHMEDKSFVLPDVLLASGATQAFYSPQFFYPNHIGWFGGDGSADFCRMHVAVLGEVLLQVAFFRTGVVKRCADGSLIYQCAFRAVDADVLPSPQGEWRREGDQFELALYHHTTGVGAKGIRDSGYLRSSPWNIQGTQELKNIAYGYFTCIPKMEHVMHLMEVAMAENGQALFLPTNAPNDAQFAVTLDVYKRTPRDIEVPLLFWVDVELISPSHLWLHVPDHDATYYEIVLPKVFRIGVEPGQTLPIDGTRLTIAPQDCRNFEYVIVGDGDSREGLLAPYHEEETLQIAKVDEAPSGSEIIERWYEKRNTYTFGDRTVELALLNKDQV